MSERGIRRPEKALTAQKVRGHLGPGKHFDGNGLYLRVDSNGARYWVQRIVIRGKRREIGLGSPTLTSLAEARSKALENRKLARAGGDPLAVKRKTATILSFEEAARAAHVELSPTWKNPKDAASLLNSLETYTFKRFGSMSVADVTSADIRQAILAARLIAPEVARKLVFRTSAVFKWAIAEGMRLDNPAATDALALPRVEKKVQHLKALHYNQVANCINAVQNSGAMDSTKLVMEFLILTGARSVEAREAVWDEIDLANALWSLPGPRMKNKKLHRVPLTARAMDILQIAKSKFGNDGLVFPGAKHGRPLSDMTLTKLVKALGYDATVHGFRSSFRTWAQEKTDYPRELAEVAISHKVGDAVEQAYARSDMFKKRRKMMESWSLNIATNANKIDHIA